MRKFIKIFDSVFAFLCVVIFSFVTAGSVCIPDSITSYEEGSGNFTALYSYCDEEKTQSVDYQPSNPTSETIKFLGVIPVKTVAVSHKTSKSVLVSGESFGIKLYTNGVIVVGTQSVDLGNKRVNPASDAGIEVGDIIVSINKNEVFTSDDVTQVLNDNNAMPYVIKVKRDGRYKEFTLTPVYSEKEGCYKAGMWVRDSTAGIGTITFYNEDTGMFAALGHQINDVDTNELMPLLDGEAVSARVTGIQKASSGNTGSLCCTFESNTIGKLIENSQYGVYGSYSQVGSECKSYTVASKQEVEKGKAKIITTIDENGPKEYDIEITHISYNKGSQQKDIVFKVTDEELIEKTGGIVQGMSGSPIIQNSKLIGAVTHVIVNNPQKGYAIFAQTMLEESEK